MVNFQVKTVTLAGWWIQKSESTKECLRTHLTNQLALKIDSDREFGP